MSNTFAFGKRVLAVATAVATIAWAVGIAAFAVPQTAHAASAGDLIKGTSLSTVYYYGYDGLRYTFPNLKTYNTWYSDFSGVMTLSDSAVADIDLGGNVVYRPGARWIKIQSDTKTYAVSTSGAIHWIETETVATDLAGSDWNTMIDDVPDVFFVDYSAGASLMSATAWDGMMYMDGADYYINWAGEKRMVSAAGRTANNMQDRFFLDGANIDDTALTAGAQITSNVCNLTDAAQTGCTTTVTTGDLMLSLSSSTPAGATLPLGANSVEVLSVDVKAGSEAATLDGLAVSMVGVGATTNVTNVYLYEGTDRLTDARSVNASTRKATFNNLAFDLAAGETRTITVRVETYSSGNQGDQVQFAVSAADDVSSAGDVSGSFPLTGNAFTLATVSAGSITIEKNGTIVNPTLGGADKKIGQFKLTAGTEDASVEEITLKIDNASDHSDFKLYNGTDLLALGSYLGNKLVRFDLSASPLEIAEGANDILHVTADIGGDNGDDVKVYLDNSTDLVAIGGDYGFGLTVTKTSYDGDSCTTTSGDCSFSDVEGGDITLAFNGPSAGDVPRNSQDVSLFEFSLTSVGDITVKDLDIIVVGDDDADDDPFDGVEGGGATADDDGLINDGAEANLKDIKIVNIDTGAVLMGPLELDTTTDSGADEDDSGGLDGDAEDADQVIDFTDDFFMEAGETLNLRVTADIDNDVTSGTEFGAVLDISGFSAEDANGSAVSSSSIVPSSDLTGYSQEALSSTLTVELASAPTSTTVVQGTNDVNFLGAVFTAGDASDVTITSITAAAHGDDTDTSNMTAGGASGFQVEDYLSSCSLYDEDDALVDGPKSVATSGDVVFDTLNWTLAAGGSETLYVHCNVANTSDVDDDVIAFDILATTDVVAQDEDSNAPTVTLTASGSGDEGINDSSASQYDATVGITITQSGSMTVSAGSATPSSDYILTSSSDAHVATYTLLATNEAFTVKTFTVVEEQAEDDTADNQSSVYANNVSQVKIEYPKADGSTGTKSVSMAGAFAKFSGLDLYVGEAEAANVKVYVTTPATDRVSGGYATSNEKLELGFYDGTDATYFEATGLSSGETLNGASSGINEIESGIGTFVVRETKPTVTASASTPSGTGFVPGDMEVLRFNVAAHANEDVVLYEMIFKMSSTDNGSTDWNFCDTDASGTGEIDEPDFDLYNLSTTGTTSAIEADANWTFLTTDATVCTDSTDETAYALVDLTTPQVVPAGTTYTYALYFDSTGASSANDDSVQFSIPADPIVSTYLDSTEDEDGTGVANELATNLGTAPAIGSSISEGDLVCITTTDDGTCDGGEEVALATYITGSTLYMARGYLGTNAQAVTASDNLYRLPTSFLWRDDGLTTTATTSNSHKVFWGSYLVDSLPVTGGAIGF